MKRCVLTGATGLIGAEVVRALAAQGWEVHAVSRRPPAGGGAVWHALDLAAAPDLRGLPARVDAVIYLAQSEHFREFPERARDIFEVNTAAVVRFLDYARGAGAASFVFGSSGGVYGSADDSLSEGTLIPAEGGLGFYLGSKLCAEIAALNYARLMNVVVLRFFFVYGPGQRRTMLVPRLVDSIRAGRPVTLQGAEGIRLNPTWVGDATAAVVRSLALAGTCKINVGGPEVLTLRALCEAIGAAVGRAPVFAIEPAAPRHIVGDISKMKELLAAPRVTFREGLARLLGQ